MVKLKGKGLNCITTLCRSVACLQKMTAKDGDVIMMVNQDMIW